MHAKHAEIDTAVVAALAAGSAHTTGKQRLYYGTLSDEIRTRRAVEHIHQ
jgi:hypothetical protein